MPPSPPDDKRRRPRHPRTPGERAGHLRALPSQSDTEPSLASQEAGFPIRLDPNSPPGEFNFIVPQAHTNPKRSPQLSIEADGLIPPILADAVDEVIGFIFALDQPTSGNKRP
ncbi:MAG: hypothetical protein VKN33_00835 [Candidatus Sericytochromatia bacterium]|nr:hypothetical protein [Candidatus Sericytochromatia bacterium]